MTRTAHESKYRVRLNRALRIVRESLMQNNQHLAAEAAQATAELLDEYNTNRTTYA